MNKEEELTDLLMAHGDVVKRIQEKQPEENYLYDLADLFRIFGDSTRVKILFALIESELCVGDISSILDISQSTVSHQLRVLKDAKLVHFRREGKVIFYSLADDHVRTILHMGMDHIME